MVTVLCTWFVDTECTSLVDTEIQQQYALLTSLQLCFELSFSFCQAFVWVIAHKCDGIQEW